MTKVFSYFFFQVDMSTTKTSRTSQTLAKSRMETIVMRLHEKMSAPPEYRVTIRFLPTNADRDLLEPYDEEDETLFVEKHKRKFQRVFVGCSITHLVTAGLNTYWLTFVSKASFSI